MALPVADVRGSRGESSKGADSLIGAPDNNALCRDRYYSSRVPAFGQDSSWFAVAAPCSLAISIRIHAALGWSVLKMYHSRMVEPDYITVVHFHHDFTFELDLEETSGFIKQHRNNRGFVQDQRDGTRRDGTRQDYVT